MSHFNPADGGFSFLRSVGFAAEQVDYAKAATCTFSNQHLGITFEVFLPEF
jgi:hypothetical protein